MMHLDNDTSKHTLCGVLLKGPTDLGTGTIPTADNNNSMYIVEVEKYKNQFTFCPECLGIYYLQKTK